MFFNLIQLLFSGFLPFKGNFVGGQNNSKCRDWAPLILDLPRQGEILKFIPTWGRNRTEHEITSR